MNDRDLPADVAIPSTTSDPSLVEYLDHPGDEYPLACPNCNDADSVVAIIRANVEQTLVAVYDVETSAPDYVLDPDEWEVGDTPAEEKLVGVRCSHCRWGYQGQDPLARLVRQR